MATQHPATSSDATPISPVSRTSTTPFSPPSVDTNTPAINDAPIELPADGIAVHNASRREQERDESKREEAIQQRKADKGVIVDVPAEPTAGEVEAATGVARGRFG